MKIECALAKNNYNLIKEADFFEQLHIGDDWVKNLANHVHNFFSFIVKNFKFHFWFYYALLQLISIVML
jgi:hypothetical protein